MVPCKDATVHWGLNSRKAVGGPFWIRQQVHGKQKTKNSKLKTKNQFLVLAFSF